MIHQSFHECLNELTSPVRISIEHKSHEWREVEFSDGNGCSVIAEYKNRKVVGFVFNYRQANEKLTMRL